MYSDVMVTKYTTSSLVVLLQPRPFSRALGLVQRRAAIKRLTNANRYLVSLASLASPWPSASPINPQHPQSGFFFSPLSTVRRLQPRNAHRVTDEGGGRGWKAREVGEGGGGSRAIAERAVTFVTFSLLRFSSWFAF